MRIYQQQFIEICVSDTGIGIKDEDKPKLMKAFGKLDENQGHKLNSQGVGLGLMISNMIAKALNSKEQRGLFFDSTYGQGSTFGFIIELDTQLSEQEIESYKVVMAGDRMDMLKNLGHKKFINDIND